MKKRLLLIAALCIAMVVATPSATYAIDEIFHAKNDIFFYDPDDGTCEVGQVSVGTSAIKLEKTETITKIYTYLTTTDLSTNNGKPLSAAQAAGVMGNMYAESGFDPAAIEDTTRAEKGHGLVQWTFGRWHRLEAFAAARGTSWTNLDTQLMYLRSELLGSEKAVLTDGTFASSNDPAQTALRWRIMFERADPKVAHDDRREGAAITIYEMFGGAAASCSSSQGAVAGKFVETAINFALEKPATDKVMINESDARDTYRVAKKALNPTVDWTDCGGFVATAMIASKVDEKIPKVNVKDQLAYLRSTTDRYEVNETPEMTDLKRGDLLYTDGHVLIYTGESKYPAVDASLNERVPSVRTSASVQWMLDHGAVSVRMMK